jgi:hypothetical protein
MIQSSPSCFNIHVATSRISLGLGRKLNVRETSVCRRTAYVDKSRILSDIQTKKPPEARDGLQLLSKCDRLPAIS